MGEGGEKREGGIKVQLDKWRKGGVELGWREK